jgi:hypothetical protein
VGNRLAAHEAEEVVQDQSRPGVPGEHSRDGQKASLVPVDHGRQGVDNGERAHPGVGQGSHRGIAEPEPADEHIQAIPLGRLESEGRQFLLRHREQAGHEKILAELHLVHLDAENRFEAAAKAQVPHGGGLPVQLFESHAHGSA